jgi:hypothetical protein
MEQSKYNYVAAYEEVQPPPPHVEVQRHPATVETNLGFVLTLANLLITGIIIVAMMIDGTQAKTAIIAGSIYFAGTTILFTLLVTGSLTEMVNGWQHQKTERYRIDAYESLGEQAIEWRLAVEETRQIELMGRKGSAHPLPPAGQLQSYVAPFADGEQAQVEGTRFAMSLYDTQGCPDHTRVHSDGRLKLRMIGSKRGSGSREAGVWLLKQGIIQRVRGGYAIDLEHYPHRDSLRHLL